MLTFIVKTEEEFHDKVNSGVIESEVTKYIRELDNNRNSLDFDNIIDFFDIDINGIEIEAKNYKPLNKIINSCLAQYCFLKQLNHIHLLDLIDDEGIDKLKNNLQEKQDNYTDYNDCLNFNTKEQVNSLQMYIEDNFECDRQVAVSLISNCLNYAANLNDSLENKIDLLLNLLNGLGLTKNEILKDIIEYKKEEIQVEEEQEDELDL